MLKINEKVPNLKFDAFVDGEIKKMNIEDFKGQWLILFFYPADFTFVCPTELGELADHYSEIKEMDGEVISVSTDTAYVHKAWHDSSDTINKINFPMAADPAGKISKTFGTYLENEGLSLRGTFIIDPEGTLKIMEIHHNDIGRSIKELIRKIQAAKYVNENNGKVCPASWEPGEDDLDPSLDLVGNI
jgi:peroxiredoxin (alkyl hydroperoxide reductase subunit C)